MVKFELLGPITDIETIARGRGINELARLRRQHGNGRWRKLKGKALVRLVDGWVGYAEIHWYEAHGIGRRDMKVKRRLE
jgi:hypothetical protein